MTRRLFIEETTPGATSASREIFEPTPEEMAELGWVRFVPLEVGFAASEIEATGPPVATTNIVIGHTETGDPVHATNGNGRVRKPCPVHGISLVDALHGCPDCHAWHERDSEPAKAGKLPSDAVEELAREYATLQLKMGFGHGDPTTDTRLGALLDYLDERLGPAPGEGTK